MLPFVVSCRLAQLSFVLILNIYYFLWLDYLSKDRFWGFGAKLFSVGCRTKFFSAGCRTGSFGRCAGRCPSGAQKTQKPPRFGPVSLYRWHRLLGSFIICSADRSATLHFIHFCNAKRCRQHKIVKKLLGKNLKHILNMFWPHIRTE